MRATLLVLILSLAATSLPAKPPLRDVAEIDNALLAVGLADEIRKNCPNISARLYRAYRFVNGLKNRAVALGYSEAEIRAYRTSEAEKARLRQEGAAWFAANGVAPGTPESYCAVGRAEIEKDSQIGTLLRVN